MGTAASSALRDDTASAGLAYGSLTGLGAPRKLKKKPVLVLDPEELAQAHAMFHDASAEMLGEDVERAPRPATVLGLAPMLDDDPEDMGASDEVESDAEDDLPSPEAVLSLTHRKNAPPVDDTFAAEDESIFAPDLPEQAEIEDGLDLSTRIFPSLPLQPDASDESELPAEAEDVAPPETGDAAQRDASLEHVAEEPEADMSAFDDTTLPEPDALLSDYADLTPEEPKVDEDQEAPVEGRGTHAHTSDTAWVDPLDAALEDALSDEPQGPPPARFDELNPAKNYELPDEVFDLETWLADPEDADPQTPKQGERPARIDASDLADHQAEPETSPPIETADNRVDDIASPGEQDESDSDDARFTVAEDDAVDGYAFMRDPRSRRAAVASATPGQQSALRAKLLREKEEAEEAARAAEASGSILLKLWNWLRGLLSRDRD
ncbi:hypothetical protein [Aurantiacibacter aquimixticola]|uniref:Uncharacterized protein n=1 Tax=Aurantiacibacter aquimixticola TaxID=1958945 RepID=A0A419RRA1_9SPHN|nr:hypothetical protein [Aurantiacibacter aquimixticola]RJY08311.1 hypothetical protein D6201_02115 [Aurantiacibacter aquimixticola]